MRSIQKYLHYLLCLLLMFLSIISSSQETMKWSPYKHFYDQRPFSVSKAVRLISKSNSYTTGIEKIFTSLWGMKRKKFAFGDKVIKKLRKYPGSLSALVTVRLKWETQERLQRSSLDSAWDLLQTKEDTAAYYYTNAMLYKDSLYERIAFKMGYVKASADREYVDWGKIYIIHWEEQAYPIEQLHNYGEPYYAWKEQFIDSAILYFKKAIASDKSEFCYAKQLLLFMYRFRRREGIPLLINDVKLNYSTDGQKWLTKFLQWTLSPKNEILIEQL